jgi:hypothetical protein
LSILAASVEPRSSLARHLGTRIKTYLTMFLIFISAVNNKRCVCSFCNSADTVSAYRLSIAGCNVGEQNMVSSITRPPFRVASGLPFGVISQAVPEFIESSDKVARLSEAAYFYETKLRELEQNFESHAAELREEYLSVISQIHELEHKFESHAAMLREEYLAVILQLPQSPEK